MATFARMVSMLGALVTLLTAAVGTTYTMVTNYKDSQFQQHKSQTDMIIHGKDAEIARQSERTVALERVLVPGQTNAEKLLEAEENLRAMEEELQNARREANAEIAACRETAARQSPSPVDSDVQMRAQRAEDGLRDCQGGATRRDNENRSLNEALEKVIVVTSSFHLAEGQTRDVIRNAVWLGLRRSDGSSVEVTLDNKPVSLNPGQTADIKFGGRTCRLVLTELKRSGSSRRAGFSFGCSKGSPAA